MLQLKFKPTWSFIVPAALAMLCVVTTNVQAVVVFSEDFEGVTLDQQVDPANSAFDIAVTGGGSFTVVNDLIPVLHNSSGTNEFTGSQYLRYSDSSGVPRLSGSLASPVTGAFTLSFDYYEPVDTTVSNTQTATRVGLSSGNITTTANRALEINISADHGASTATLTAIGGAFPATTIDVADLVHIDIVGSFATQTYDVLVNNILEIDDVPFRNTLDSADEFGIFASGTSSRAQTAFIDNIVVDAAFDVLPVVTVDRTTGAISLSNDASANADLEFLGYSISSDFGALNGAGWKPIAGNYDASTPNGDGSVDSDDEWTILSDPGDNTSLAEFEFLGDGGRIAPGQMVTLSNVDGVWIPSSNEDLAFALLLTDGTFQELDITYVGNGGEPLSLIDLDHNGVVDAADWETFRMNHPTEGQLSSSPALAHLLGDLDGDLDNDVQDFILFKQTYTVEFGPGAFATLLAGTAVPEPATGLILIAGALGLAGLWRRSGAAGAKLAVLLGIALLSAPAKADLVSAWWRMGDSDASPVDGVVIGEDSGTGVVDEFAANGDNELLHQLQYSTEVPSGTIYDPTTQTYMANQWSTVSTAAGSRAAASNSSFDPTPNPTPVTVESFIRFDDLSNGNNRYQFLYQRSNATGGWELSSYADGRIQLNIFEPDRGPTQAFVAPAGSLQQGVWHHIAMVAAPDNSGNDDVKVYVDGDEVLSGDYTLSDQLADPGFPFLVGSVFSDDGPDGSPIFYDETRVFKEVRTPDQYLQLGSLTAVVNTVTGNVSLRNDTLAAIEIDNYRLQSPGNRLLTDWEGLGDLDMVDDGADPGETWQHSGVVGTDDISEVFWLGSSSIDVGQSVSIGTAYLAGAEDGDLSFNYHDLGVGRVVRGLIEFTDLVSDLPGDFNDDGTVNLADYTVWRNNLGGSEAVLNGNGNGSSTVDVGDYNLWKQHFGESAAAAAALQAVPEPSGLALVLLSGVLVFGRRRIGALSRSLSCLATCWIMLPATSFATVTVDASYQFGDLIEEQSFEVVFNGGTIARTYDDFFESSDLLEITGTPSYTDLTQSPYSTNKPATVGSWGALFDGVDESIGTNTAPFLTPLTTANAGVAMWVYPTSNSERQGIYFSRVNQSGIAITGDGKWTQNAAGHVNDTDIQATEDVVLNEWTHLMQHTYAVGSPGAPAFDTGTGTGGDFISVLYVNGTVVSAHIDNYSIDTDGPLLFGAESPGSETNFFSGVIGDADLYSDAGFNLFTDNEAIVSQIATISSGAITDGNVLPGDVNVDGVVDTDDITAFVAGWNSKNHFPGFHGDVFAGDLTTWLKGDMDLDGKVELDDAFVLHIALEPLGGFPFQLLKTHTVPEPATASLVGLIALSGLVFAGRSRAKSRLCHAGA